MDKKDQDNNSVGDDFNLSHENQLPPIWEHISEELNALDGDSLSMDEPSVDSEDVSDAADFSIIKEGFQANFVAKEPPKFMWDKIEQNLESFTTTDAPSDFSAIKEGFEQNYKKTTAPNFTWADLAEEMDNPKPKETVDDYAFVKRGFEKQYSAVVVPLFSWADLAKRMDNEAILADTPDKFSIIKESFQTKYASHKPATTTWAELDQKLNAGSRWKKALVLWFAPTFWKQAGLFTAIGLLIVGGHFCFTEDSFLEHPTAIETPATAIIAGNQANENASILEDIQIPSFKKGTSRSHTVDVAPQEPVSNEDQMNAALLFLEKEASKSVRTKNKTSGNQLASEKASNTSENQSTSEKTSKASESLPSKNESIKDNNGLPPVLIDENKATNSSSNDALALGGMDTEPKSAIEKQVELEEEERLRSNLKWLANGSNPSWIEQDVMDVELLEDGLSLLIQKYIADEEIPKMEEGSFTLVQQMQKGKKIRFEVGLTAVGGTSVLLGQNTYDAWNGNTSTTTMSPTATFGLLSNYHFSLNDALVLGIYPYATVKQGFGAYNSAGNYEETQLKLSLFDISLGYQRTLIRYNSLGQIPSKMYARLDLGLGILTNAKTTVNDATINTTDLYNKFNFSVGVALGNTHEVKQFLIDYGIRGNIGLNNIVTSADPNILEPARLLNVGAFVGLRYLIVPRLEPSKKQRQFDWSPPFYIEEPAF
ncbi:MAG: Unknown protein [uncultured Aureispira sp.]|uniref:Outer membrane protein beta-barrel domain-containing protein n=1 Tax=uncultured Aureispira sp. TaxID=1331704 RepID=A0A6S6TLQ3_9BACT|nr:MAG: Unknown protein [uncultured Aureispira sp.]